jgi:hypothetical protein
MSQFLYHFRPKDMVGNILFPLNRLKDAHPDLYLNQIKKYENRSWILNKQIPSLNCLWNDVLHLSPVNPQIILDSWKKEGLYHYANSIVGRVIEVYKIPIDLICEDTTVCFQSFNFEFHNTKDELDKFWSFESEKYIEQFEISTDQVKVWHLDKSENRKLFWFSHTMHVLANQEINIENCEIILCQ